MADIPNAQTGKPIVDRKVKPSNGEALKAKLFAMAKSNKGSASQTRKPPQY